MQALSSVRLYAEHRDLAFFLYEKQMADKFHKAHVRAKRMGVTADVMSRDSQASTGYWDIVQDACADLVRIMLVRCFDQENYPELCHQARSLRGQPWLTAFPNLFITIAPAEWKYTLPYFLLGYIHCVFAGAYVMALHVYSLTRCIWLFLASRFGNKYFIVQEWLMKTEYQGRGTEHFHIAAWVICLTRLSLLSGRSGMAVLSAFVLFLELVFHAQIDVQVGNGRLNYINGYVTKDHDAVDVGLGEYVQRDSTSSWLAAFRLMSKSTPCIPEVAIRMAQLPELLRSYTHVLLYPPQPAAMVDFEGRQGNFSAKMYGFYLEEKRQQSRAGVSVGQSFLQWHRDREYDKEGQQPVFRGMKHQHGARQPTRVVACRYWYELTDGFWGQFALTQLPHWRATQLLPRPGEYLEVMINFAGILGYLRSWRWGSPGLITVEEGGAFDVGALPYIVDSDGNLAPLAVYRQGESVFSSDREAYGYAASLARRDLEYRGFRDDRVRTFDWKTYANYLLQQRVKRCADSHEYELLRQDWDHLNRPEYKDFKWHKKQLDAILAVEQGTSYEDEHERRQSSRYVYICGAPGSGKSAVILECAIRSAKKGIRVLIVCPTGLLVHQYKASLPDSEGVENVGVDTIQGVLKYKRPGPDGKVRWAPPSALRRIDLILVDEASQYDDRE